MRIGYALTLALSVATPALAQVIVTTPQPGPVVREDHSQQMEKRAARLEDRAARDEAARGNYGNAQRDAERAAQDRAAAHTP